MLAEFFAAGWTDYFAQLFIYGKEGDRSQGFGIVIRLPLTAKAASATTTQGFCRRPSRRFPLAMKAHAGHVIASGLLATYLGQDAGRRVHSGAIMRGSVDKLSAVLWYADIRGFTRISDSAPGALVIELLNDIFETLTAALRPRGGQVLKFIGDAVLATFSFEEADRAETCRRGAGRRDRGDAKPRRAERVARGGRRTGRFRRSRPPHRGSAVRQCRRDRPSRFHRHRPRGQ